MKREEGSAAKRPEAEVIHFRGSTPVRSTTNVSNLTLTEVTASSQFPLTGGVEIDLDRGGVICREDTVRRPMRDSYRRFSDRESLDSAAVKL